jgi:hypothetical protein
MTIWLLALLLMLSLAGLGYRQGVIRVAFSFVGILFGAMLATPLAPLMGRGVSLVVKQPLLAWLLPPVVVFAVVLAAFKIAGLAVHNKVEVHYKYKVDDLGRALWERLSRRLGLCLSFLNSAAYLVLISFVIYAGSYWTVQLSAAGGDPLWFRFLSQLGRDLQRTGMDRVGWAIDRLPESYYDAADVAGILYHTPPLELKSRLLHYPAFLGLAERADIQGIYDDNDFTQSWRRQVPVGELLGHPRLAALVKNRDWLKTIWTAAGPNLEDLAVYLRNGVSQKFDEKILGRWRFDANGTISLLRRVRPNINSKEMLQIRNSMAMAFSGMTLVAMPDQQALLKNVPPLQPATGTAPSIEPQTLTGQWKSSGSRYVLTLSSQGRTDEVIGEFKGERLALTIQGIGLDLAFEREQG